MDAGNAVVNEAGQAVRLTSAEIKEIDALILGVCFWGEASTERRNEMLEARKKLSADLLPALLAELRAMLILIRSAGDKVAH